ncbi:MAG: PadR family transcriptional regulator [Gammaproteobacteria bacterium]
MSVKDLCLGALTFGNASGYDIKKFFPQSFSHFYAADYGSIYPALTELTVAGLMGCLHKRAAPGRTASSIALRSRDHVVFAHGLPATQSR